MEKCQILYEGAKSKYEASNESVPEITKIDRKTDMDVKFIEWKISKVKVEQTK